MRLLLACGLLTVVLSLFGLEGRPHVADAQASTQINWNIQVDNTSPAGHNWSFNAFYPDRFQAHAGDLISFRVANNPNALHAIELLPAGWTPDQGYPGFDFIDDDDSPPTMAAVYFNSKPFFGAQPSTLCGRGGNEPCVFEGMGTTSLKSGVLVPPPSDGSGTGNPSFSFRLGPNVRPGTYFFICLVHGPSMQGSVDVLPKDQRARSPEDLRSDADRSYQADVFRLTDLDRGIRNPDMITNPDGSRSWTVAAGGGSPDTNLSINEFGVPHLFIQAGDSVTWTNQGPQIVAHTVTGFSTDSAHPVPRLDPYLPVCGGPDPDQNGETSPDVSFPPGSGRFPPDIWNDCPPWQQEDHLTDYALASAADGAVYTSGSVTSGLLLPAGFLESAIGFGLPFPATFTVRFPNPGSYRYACMIHSGMTGSIEVLAIQP
jgi:plastocyanin